MVVPWLPFDLFSRTMEEYRFEEKKLYKFDGGCLYVIKRKKRAIKGVLVMSNREIYLDDKSFNVAWNSAVELGFKIETTMMIKPKRYNAEYVEVCGHTICSYCVADKYKCPLMFTGISKYRLKELKDAGVEFGNVFLDAEINGQRETS